MAGTVGSKVGSQQYCDMLATNATAMVAASKRVPHASVLQAL